jgi:hypothetical protein
MSTRAQRRSLDSAIDYVVDDRGALDVTPRTLHLPRRSAEANRCEWIRAMIREYVSRENVKRPLSIAVFGPPGSGKSHSVGQILASMRHCEEMQTVNLSQLASPSQLATALAPIKNPRSTRVLFFDEFDGPLDGVPLGWLRWFLAPMQDGRFLLDGTSIAIGKAIFLFAGGTAGTLAEFDERSSIDLSTYRARKVPDFISRLRGFLDIGGVNIFGDERHLRRAVILHDLLEKRWPGRRNPRTGRFPIDRDIIRSLLSNVHYVHGVRSMEALLDMCRIKGAGNKVTLQLPDNEITKLHLSRGQLDGQLIGISAGQQDVGAAGLLKALAEELLKNGATLAYGGDFMPQGTLDHVVSSARHVPDKLFVRHDRRVRNYLSFPTFLSSRVVRQREWEDNEQKKVVDFVDLWTLSETEIADLGIPRDRWFSALPLHQSDPYDPKHHVAWALSLFRMRVRLMQDLSALVVLGGKNDGRSWGRFAGIAEEVMLALALGKPVYVLGDSGGAAEAVGRQLGLDQTIGNTSHGFVQADDARFTAAVAEYAHCFSVPGSAPLPLNITELRSFLFDRSISTPLWPWNGLNVNDNRQLFACPFTKGASKVDRAVRLIVQGLSRLDWKIPSRRPL